MILRVSRSTGEPAVAAEDESVASVSGIRYVGVREIKEAIDLAKNAAAGGVDHRHLAARRPLDHHAEIGGAAQLALVGTPCQDQRPKIAGRKLATEIAGNRIVNSLSGFDVYRRKPAAGDRRSTALRLRS